jgi:hypothetical protein
LTDIPKRRQNVVNKTLIYPIFAELVDVAAVILIPKKKYKKFF